jgi:glutaredoxin
MTKELVMYSRTYGCPYISVAKRVLTDHALGYREIFIDKDPDAKARVLEWTGFLSVPTIIVAEVGALLPLEPPLPLAKGASPRGIDRGAMITEASVQELTLWLQKHGFIPNED